MAIAVSSYFARPAASGSSAVNTSPQALQRYAASWTMPHREFVSLD